MLDVKVEGYTFDSQYATYMYDSSRRNYSLDDIVNYWFAEFGDYKRTMVQEWKGNFANAPLSKLVPYNCADCDVVARVADRFADKISLPLLKVYIEDAYVLDSMESRGPYLDLPAYEWLAAEVPKLKAPIERKLKQMAGDPNFNCGTPEQVAALLFDKLGLTDYSTDKQGAPNRSTEARDLSILAQKSGHRAPTLVTQWRALAVVENTFLKGYKRSADAHQGMLFTKWWLSGAATGRLRSGSSGGEEGDIINMQNTHGSPLMQNLLASDPDWRLVLE
jgi:DNA polymerase-1